MRRLLNQKEAAEYMGRTARWLRSKTAAGEIPVIRDGRATLYRIADLDAWVEARREGATSA